MAIEFSWKLNIILKQFFFKYKGLEIVGSNVVPDGKDDGRKTKIFNPWAK